MTKNSHFKNLVHCMYNFFKTKAKNLLYIISPQYRRIHRKNSLIWARTNVLKEVFLKQDYYWLIKDAPPNTWVIDIGAFIGDTAIYFAQFPNVKAVRAYEPIPDTWQEAKANIEGSPFKDKIEISNLAVTGDGKPVQFSAHSWMSLEKGNEVKVNSVTLDEIINGLDGNIVIKSDCEGGEHTLFTASRLDKVSKSIMEEHEYADTKLRKYLTDSGFKINVVATSPGLNYIYAERAVMAMRKKKRSG